MSKHFGIPFRLFTIKAAYRLPETHATCRVQHQVWLADL